jgi:hypothetical protein
VSAAAGDLAVLGLLVELPTTLIIGFLQLGPSPGCISCCQSNGSVAVQMKLRGGGGAVKAKPDRYQELLVVLTSLISHQPTVGLVCYALPPFPRGA